MVSRLTGAHAFPTEILLTVFSCAQIWGAAAIVREAVFCSLTPRVTWLWMSSDLVLAGLIVRLVVVRLHRLYPLFFSYLSMELALDVVGLSIGFGEHRLLSILLVRPAGQVGLSCAGRLRTLQLRSITLSRGYALWRDAFSGVRSQSGLALRCCALRLSLQRFGAVELSSVGYSPFSK